METVSQETRAAIDMKWESVQPYMETLVIACNLVDEFCSLEPPRLISARDICQRFYDGRLPYMK